LFQVPNLIDAFEGHPRRQSCIADKGDDVEVFVTQVSGCRYPQRGRMRSSGVGGFQYVVFGFLATQDPAQPVVLANRRELVAASGEDLVRVRLMTYVDNQFVARGLQRVVERNYQLDRA